MHAWPEIAAFCAQALLSTLRSLDDAGLAVWAAAHREKLSLPFLGWLAEKESAASSADAKEQLWALGSKLMALREGLSPVGMERLQAELSEAALSASAASSSSRDEGDEEIKRSPLAGPAGSASRGPPGALQLRAGSLGSVVQQTAALGLSPEGLVLLQQQAAALEAAVGFTRAKSLTEVIGRKAVAPGEGLHVGMEQADEVVSGRPGLLHVLLGLACCIPPACDARLRCPPCRPQPAAPLFGSPPCRWVPTSAGVQFMPSLR